MHKWIDMTVGVGSVGFENVAADDAGDAAFARRLYLDLTGTIPGAEPGTSVPVGPIL